VDWRFPLHNFWHRLSGHRSGGRSAFHFQVRLFGRFNGCGRFAAPPGALLPDVMSQASSRKEQRRERDEKDN
jgi:hypothetical protein